jgi:hypothetical protein
MAVFPPGEIQLKTDTDPSFLWAHIGQLHDIATSSACSQAPSLQAHQTKHAYPYNETDLIRESSSSFEGLRPASSSHN